MASWRMASRPMAPSVSGPHGPRGPLLQSPMASSVSRPNGLCTLSTLEPTGAMGPEAHGSMGRWALGPRNLSVDCDHGAMGP